MIDISHDFLQILDYVHEFVSHSDGELHKWDTFIYIYIYMLETNWRVETDQFLRVSEDTIHSNSFIYNPKKKR